DEDHRPGRGVGEAGGHRPRIERDRLAVDADRRRLVQLAARALELVADEPVQGADQRAARARGRERDPVADPPALECHLGRATEQGATGVQGGVYPAGDSVVDDLDRTTERADGPERPPGDAALDLADPAGDPAELVEGEAAE